MRRELRTTHEPAEGELNLAVGAQTDVTLELATPWRTSPSSAGNVASVSYGCTRTTPTNSHGPSRGREPHLRRPQVCLGEADPQPLPQRQRPGTALDAGDDRGDSNWTVPTVG